MDRLLRDFGGAVRLELRDAAGTLVDATGPVTAAVTDSAGAAMAGSPFIATKPTGTTGTYDVAVPAAAAAVLDTYDVRWSATLAGQAVAPRSRFEVVGGFLFTVAELRAADPVLADTAKYPQAALEAAREAAEERLEELCGVAFRPRGARETRSGDGTARLLLGEVEPTRLVSVSIDRGAGPVALTAEEVADVRLEPWGEAVRLTKGVWDRGVRNVAVLYERGVALAPEPVRRAALTLAKAALIRSPVPDRATAESTEAGTIRYSIAGRDGPTGYPEVDAVVEQFGRTVPAVG
jgi:hypothetical protein